MPGSVDLNSSDLHAAAESDDAADVASLADLFASLPSDLQQHLLVRAGGPSALTPTRRTSKLWQATLDSLCTVASSSCIPAGDVSRSFCAVLTRLPRLHTVDLSAVAEALPPGRLSALMVELSALPALRSLKLSTWCLATTTQQAALDHDNNNNNSGQQPPPPSASRAAQISYDLVLPGEIASFTQLQELCICACAEVSPPPARRMELAPAIMRLQGLTHLELFGGFLPHVHHLRGMKNLRRLSISTQHAGAGGGGGAVPLGAAATAATAGAGPAGASSQGGWWQQAQAAVDAAIAAVHAAQGMRELALQLPACGGAMVATKAGALISTLMECMETHTNSMPAGSGPAASAAGAADDGDVDTTDNNTTTSSTSSSCSVSSSSRSYHGCQLQVLQLTGSNLYHLGAKFAVACASLRHLDLSRSQLTDASVLGGLSLLTHLCVADGGLREVPASWARLTSVQVLNLSGNSIGPTLPPHVSRLTSLHTLVLSSNHLLELPRFVKSLTRLSHLDVASNKLQELPDELCACVQLRQLDASKNRLLVLPPQFSALSRITQLSLTGNHLEALPSVLPHHCLSLGLALNYYKHWRQVLPCFASLAHTLQELELQHTATVMHDAGQFLAAVGQLTALTCLAAGSNQLSDLPSSWQQLKRLEVLQLSHNALEVLPISLLALTALTFLDVSYNRLTALPFWVGSSKLQQLRRLNLAKNHLTTLPVEMSGLSRLTQLQLQGNNLAAAPPCLVNLQQLRLLNIGGNYKLKEGHLGQQLAGLVSLRDVVLPYRLAEAAAELQSAGKAVVLD